MGRPITVAVGPLANASATQVSLSQKSAAAGYLVLNGAAGSFSANSICLSQTPGGAGALTLNGASVANGAAWIGAMQRIYITAAGNDSGRTFTVVGTGYNASGGPFSVTETITGPNASTVSSANLYMAITSITVDAGTAGAITVGTYGTATLDKARQVLITSAGNDSGITFTLTGTDVNGSTISEAVTGGNATTATSVLDYETLTSILTSGAVASTVTVGTNGVARSQWVRFDDYAAMAAVSIQCTASGTVDYTVQQTMQDPNGPDAVAAASIAWLNHPDSNLVAATTTVQGNYGYAPMFARVQLNSGTGSVSTVFRQAFLK